MDNSNAGARPILQVQQLLAHVSRDFCMLVQLLQRPLLCAVQEEEEGGDGEEVPAVAPAEEAPLMSDADMTQLMRVCPMAFTFVASEPAQLCIVSSVG